MNATFCLFFIPGDTISCNVTYPGRPGPPGFDGPPGRINEKLLFSTFPRVKELVRQMNRELITWQLVRIVLKLSSGFEGLWEISICGKSHWGSSLHSLGGVVGFFCFVLISVQQNLL